MSKLSEFKFNIKAISKLYLAKTVDDNLLQKSKNFKEFQKKTKLEKNLTPRLQDQIKHDRTIKFSNLQLFKLFVCCGKSKEKRLYNKGISKLTKDLDLL